MSCIGDRCGTGGWMGPLPGDPDNNLVLSAQTVFGGILVSWSYPAINPHAVAHTILYRGPTIDFNLAIQREVVKGSSFYDMIDPPEDTLYYYWIRMVSINGTEAELVGPVSCIARKRSSQLIDDLDGLISDALLNTILKAEMANIAFLRSDLTKEINDRLAANTTLQNMLADVEAANGQIQFFLDEEITQRISEDGALLQMINSMGVTVNGNLAAIIDERIVRADEDSALSARIDTTFATANDAMAAVVSETSARVSADEAIASDVTTLTARIDGVEGDQISSQEFNEVKADIEGLHGQWGIKMQTNDPLNPVIAGIALAVEDPVAGPGASSLVFMADKVAFYTLNGKLEPFGILGNQVNINGNAIFTGTLQIRSSTESSRTEMTNNKIDIYDNGGLRVRLGKLT